MDFVNKIQTAYAKRHPYIIKNGLDAFRLGSLDEIIPGASIDIYADNAVVHIFDAATLGLYEKLVLSLKQCGIKEVFLKNRIKGSDGKSALARTQKIVIAHEYGALFECNVSDYLDVGLFLDHREMRQFIRSKAKNKIVLNTFAYTGSFSVQAALGGAARTYSVDVSKTYCDWMRRNLELNHLPSELHWIYKMDTFEFFHYAKRKQMFFDIIIIDPPTFSHNKGKPFHVQKKHVELLQQSAAILAPRGFILFSNNYTEFHLDRQNLHNFKIKEENRIPPDCLIKTTNTYFIRAYAKNSL